MQFLVAFCSRPEAAIGVISDKIVWLIVPEKHVKFRDPCLNHFQAIPPIAIGFGIFVRFSRYNFPPEVVNGVISGVAVESVGVDVCVKFDYSRSNISRDTLVADCASNEHTNEGTNMTKAHHIRQKRLKGVSLKNGKNRPYVSMES